MRRKYVSKTVEKEMARLRAGVLVPCVPRLYDIKEKTIKILFHKVRSLHCHFDHAKCDC